MCFTGKKLYVSDLKFYRYNTNKFFIDLFKRIQSLG